MITIQSAMLVALGVFLAGLVAFLVAPFYGRRAARLATEGLRRSMPMTEAEIRADKDLLRAQHAIVIHKLEMKLEDRQQSAARQSVEINRRDAAISATEGEVARLKTSLEEHENARRVLEQTITDRLPRVEHRLTEAKKLLFQRDREIASLTQQAGSQAQALEEAMQINTQQRDEIHRLNATLTARAARNREPFAPDARFDGEVALRAEIEALRAKTRDQAQVVDRLQAAYKEAGLRPEGIAGAAANGHAAGNGAARAVETESARLRHDLAEAELALKAARSTAEAGQSGQTTLENEVRALKSANQDQAAEIARLKAALKTYEAEDAGDRAVKDSKIAMRARLSALEAQSEQQQAFIHSLRAEVAAANEKLARQAAHYMDEMRRIGAGTLPVSGVPRRDTYDAGKRRSLSSRIAEPRAEKAASEVPPTGDGAAPGPLPGTARPSSYLSALIGAEKDKDVSSPGAADPAPPATANGAAPAASAASAPGSEPASAQGEQKRRRPGLLERISGADKPAASNG